MKCNARRGIKYFKTCHNMIIINFINAVTTRFALGCIIQPCPWLFSYNSKHMVFYLYFEMIWPVTLPSIGEWDSSGASICRGHSSPSYPVHLCKVWWCAGNGLPRCSYRWHHTSVRSDYVPGCAERGHFLCVLQQVSSTKQVYAPNFFFC